MISEALHNNKIAGHNFFWMNLWSIDFATAGKIFLSMTVEFMFDENGPRVYAWFLLPF